MLGERRQHGMTPLKAPHALGELEGPSAVREVWPRRHIQGPGPPAHQSSCVDREGRSPARRAKHREFPGGLVVRIRGFHCVAQVQSLDWDLPQATWQEKKEREREKG